MVGPCGTNKFSFSIVRDVLSNVLLVPSLITRFRCYVVSLLTNFTSLYLGFSLMNLSILVIISVDKSFFRTIKFSNTSSKIDIFVFAAFSTSLFSSFIKGSLSP